MGSARALDRLPVVQTALSHCITHLAGPSAKLNLHCAGCWQAATEPVLAVTKSCARLFPTGHRCSSTAAGTHVCAELHVFGDHQVTRCVPFPGAQFAQCSAASHCPAACRGVHSRHAGGAQSRHAGGAQSPAVCVGCQMPQSRHADGAPSPACYPRQQRPAVEPSLPPLACRPRTAADPGQGGRGQVSHSRLGHGHRSSRWAALPAMCYESTLHQSGWGGCCAWGRSMKWCR